MKEEDISNDEIQILGQDWNPCSTRRHPSGKRRGLLLLLLLAVACGVSVFLFKMHEKQATEDATEAVSVPLETLQPEGTVARGFIEVNQATVNDVPLLMYIPHNALPELTLELPVETDSTVIFTTQAADIGGNNYGIVGDFVLAGEPLARGVRKEGFCAIIHQNITLGVTRETPLLEEAIREKGYFFRQYPLVKNFVPIENKPRGKSIRRALAIRAGQVVMIVSRERESFHDFAQALADMGVSEAIYLVGGITVYGWYREADGKQTIFGEKQAEIGKGVSYLVWRCER
jgi:hypothetical protein